MRTSFLSLIALGWFAGAAVALCQPGPITTANTSNLIFAASTLLTNGLPGLSGPPATLMVNSVQSSSAQGGAVSLVTGQPWVRRYNGPANSEDQAFAVVADKDGNVIVGGYSYEIGQGVDYLTIKYTPEGLGLWTNRYDGPDHGTDKVEAMAVDGSGGVYVSGSSGSGITTIKYATNGTPAWTNTYSSSASFLYFTGFAVDSLGNAYITAIDDDSDSFITVKYAANGIPAWTNFFKSSVTSMESASDIAVDAAGNIFVTGLSFDSSLGGNSCLTIKYASNGSVLWTNRYSVDGSGGSGAQIIVDRQQNVVVAADLHGVAGNKYSVIKYSNSGTMLWSNVITAVNYAGGGVPRIAVDPAGNVFLNGGTPGATTADFTTVKYSSTGISLWTNRFVDPNSGTQEFDGAATDNAGNMFYTIASASPGGANYNYVTLKYAANGTAVWTNRYNAPANSSDLTRAMTVDKAGGVYVTGTSSSGGTSMSALDWATVKYADNVRYVPPANFVGQDTITFTAFDSFGNSATGTVVVIVVPGPLAVVAPDDYTSVAGNTGLNTLVRGTGAPRTYQMQFTPDALGGLPAGARITGLRFRVSTNTAVNFPETTIAWSDYEVRLAQAANPITSMSTTFSANLLNPVLVKDGALSVLANSFSAGGNPNPFSTLMVLDTPYVYQGGDLMMQFTHTGSDSTNTTYLDGANSSAPGFGTSFRAISANTFGATTGISASVTVVQIEFTPTIIQVVTRTGNQVVINGAGGLAGASYRVLTSTNITLPAAQWTPIITNQCVAGGGFSYTNVIQPSEPARYFRVSMP
jgi:outer membrane protein assembly factor BamB